MLHKSAKSRGCLPQSVRHVEDFIGAGSYEAAILRQSVAALARVKRAGCQTRRLFISCK